MLLGWSSIRAVGRRAQLCSASASASASAAGACAGASARHGHLTCQRLHRCTAVLGLQAALAQQRLQQLTGCTCRCTSAVPGQYARSMLYCASSDEMVFPAGGLVVAMTAGLSGSSAGGGGGSSSGGSGPPGRQRCFVGHNAFVCCLALGGGGRLLATGQEGAPLIRLWAFGGHSTRHAGAVGDAAGAGGAGAGTADAGACLAVLSGEPPLPWHGCSSNTAAAACGAACSPTPARAVGDCSACIPAGCAGCVA